MHTTVEEIWYVVSGTGRVWRKRGNTKSIDTIPPDTAFLIPPRVRFQFRAVGDDPFRAVIVTMPPWPGEHEAVHVENYWSTG